jgi:folate-binding protein YgfZ
VPGSSRTPIAAAPPARQAVAWAPHPLGLVEAAGGDAVRFVDNFTTAAVSALAIGGGSEAFFTDARGQVLTLATILRTETGMLVVTPPGLAATLRDHLEHYHIREAVELRDASADTAAFLLAGPQAAAALERLSGSVAPGDTLAHQTVALGGLAARIVRAEGQGADGYWILVPATSAAAVADLLADAALPRADDGDFESLRLEARYPAAADIPPKTLPQELGRDARAISFTKGCYLGQETVARLDALGHVNRRLVLLAIAAAEPPAVPATVTLDGADVGLVTSAAPSPLAGGPVGLGLVQVKALAAGELRVAGSVARVAAAHSDQA